ncbi:inverted formin-2 isoform X2 [Microcaecilia unicolor]|uniref:Inverted formin-2-like isoform X2 n=1 Tax=Microcaecilia unicolor TaxID=1415580 RepID=A0A6P7XZI2_9AMPH|nr:inverted formin-2-like isoform X2 [Microcaecilia unicolor]
MRRSMAAWPTWSQLWTLHSAFFKAPCARTTPHSSLWSFSSVVLNCSHMLSKKTQARKLRKILISKKHPRNQNLSQGKHIKTGRSLKTEKSTEEACVEIQSPLTTPSKPKEAKTSQNALLSSSDDNAEKVAQTLDLASSVSPNKQVPPLPPPPPPPPPPPFLLGVGTMPLAVGLPLAPPLPSFHSNAVVQRDDSLGYTGNSSKKINKPALQMKTLNWQELPSTVVQERDSMWTLVSSSDESMELDYSSTEQEFCLSKAKGHVTQTALAEKQPKQVTFLDFKKSLSLNVFLKQLKSSNEEVVDMIQKGDRSKFDAEILKQLLKLLPEEHEMRKLEQFQAEKHKLANLDQFCLLLHGIPGYRLRIECMLLCEEVPAILEMLRPQSDIILAACESILTSHRLRAFCRVSLKFGNFLNYGKHKGNASGFQISSLLKLADVKGNQPRVTLLHHILKSLEEKQSDLLHLPEDLELASKAAAISICNVYSVTSSNLMKLMEMMNNISLCKDIEEQYTEPIQNYIDAFEEFEVALKAIEERRKQLAEYFCEDAKKMSLQDIFVTMKTFRELLLQAHKENRERKEQIVRAGKRKKHGEMPVKRPKGDDGKIMVDGERI